MQCYLKRNLGFSCKLFNSCILEGVNVASPLDKHKCFSQTGLAEEVDLALIIKSPTRQKRAPAPRKQSQVEAFIKQVTKKSGRLRLIARRKGSLMNLC